MKVLSHALLAIAVCASPLGAQKPADSTRCRSILGAPTPDSESKVLGILISPFDTANRIANSYRDLIATGIRQFLVLPKPLPLTTYDYAGPANPGPGRGPDLAHVTLTLESTVRATLHANGSFTDIRVLGGTRDAEFDDAMLASLKQLGESSMLPDATAPAVTMRGDSMEIRVTVRPTLIGRAPSLSRTPVQLGGPTLLQIRVPVRQLARQVRPSPNNRVPYYPSTMRNMGAEGHVTMQFVVSTDGRATPGTLRILDTNDEHFASVVVDAFPTYRFDPAQIDGCTVPMLVYWPFTFNLDRP